MSQTVLYFRHLEAELARLKLKDPIRQMEVNQDEILFDEKGKNKNH